MRRPAAESRTPPACTRPDVPAGSRLPACLLAVLLALLTLLAYHPVWRAGFIWDDDAYVTKNALLTAPDGWSRIWFSTHRQSQYFPLTYTTLRVERAFWGLNPQGYHVVNVLFHALNALLLWQLLRRLKVPGAWLAAAIFALHPVQVESVAWITELKNVQSTLFYLLAVLAWVRFAAEPSCPRWRFYGLALVCHALALFSKTTACTLPAALLLVLWWRGQRIGWQRLLQVLPFLLLGVGMGLVSVWWEKHLGNYGPDTGVELGFLERLLIATRAVWFYAAKVFWPVNLAFSYLRWQIDPRVPLQYLGLAGCVASAVVLWWRRHALGRGVAAGAIFFVAALSPLLGFIPLYTFRYSFVADHYQYLACVGLIAPCAAWISAPSMRGRFGRVFSRGLPGCLLLVLALLTWKRTHIYAHEKRLWQDTVAKNPASWMAHFCLGNIFLKEDRLEEAIRHYQQTLRLKADVGAHYNLANTFLKTGQLDEAIRQFQEVIRLNPGYAEAHYNLANTLMQKGRIAGAVRHFEEAVRLKAEDPEAHNNLANAYARQGRLDDAIARYQEALRLRPDYTEAHYNLGVVLLGKGGLDEAIRQFQEVLRLKPDFASARKHLDAALAARAEPSRRPTGGSAPP